MRHRLYYSLPLNCCLLSLVYLYIDIDREKEGGGAIPTMCLLISWRKARPFHNDISEYMHLEARPIYFWICDLGEIHFIVLDRVM